ncbi:MAG TPA: Fic family protein [Bacteroidia bacterium]|jgi:Fic family protein
MEWVKNIGEELLSFRETFEINFERIQMKKRELENKRPLPAMALQRIKEDLYIEWSYNSNSIEGNTLNLNETRMVLQEGMTVKGKSLREHLEITNHHDAIEYVEGLAKKATRITEKDILAIHEIVMLKIEKEFAGRYRNGAVRIIGANFVPPNPLKVPAFMEEWLSFTESNSLKLNDLEMAAVLHHRFVWIHPFFDGNGRTIRLLMNLFLMQKGYPPAIILKNDRKKFYEALNQANKGSYQKLFLLVAQAIERSLDIYLMAYPGANYDYMPITAIIEEEQLPYGQEYLSLLARQGKIDAFKEGRNWYTSKKAVNDYLANRKRKRTVAA